jgi:DNA-binding IclR family transcriptional regulator
MVPNFGGKNPPGDLVPDWLLGGNRKRRVLELLADEKHGGWTAAELSIEIDCGRTTAHEILRTLDAMGVLEEAPKGGMRLAHTGDLAEALRALLDALVLYRSETVERPPRRRGPT